MLIDKYGEGNQTRFAKKAGIAQSSLSRNLKLQNEEALMDVTGWILLAFPEVNRLWLLTGQGEPSESQTAPIAEHENNILVELLLENRQLRIELDVLKKAMSQENFTTAPVHGGDNAAPSLHTKTE
jgi:hypothetical protein